MLQKFDLPSAKNVTVKAAVDQFVPTELFWEILRSDGNDLIFGTRGSGKTLLLRMMSVRHLLMFANSGSVDAKAALFDEKRFGVFIPLGIDWCVAYQDRADHTARLFTDGVNLVAAEGLVDAIGTLLSEHVLPVSNEGHTERELCQSFCELWFRPGHEEILSFLGLKRLLIRQQSVLMDLWRGGEGPEVSEESGAGYYFRGAPIFAPLGQAVTYANGVLGLEDDHKWLLCLDEVEDLKAHQAKAIATFLRGATRNLVLKLTTQPYTFAGAETHYPGGVSAVDFRDFSERRLQYDPHQPAFRALAAEIVRKRLKADPSEPAEKRAFEIFGAGTFADRAQAIDPSFTKTRSSLTGVSADSARKKVPVAAIRALKRSAEGNRRSAAYSGWNTIIALSDGNPGMFVRLLNDLRIDSTAAAVDAAQQHSVANSLAGTWHEWSQALYKDGKVLYDLIDRIGNDLQLRLHSRRSNEADVQEEVNRFRLNLDELRPEESEALKVGARHALFVAEAIGSSIRYPSGEGVWRLSYGLAPKFWLLPRRGKIAKLGPQQLPLELEPVAPGRAQIGEEVADVPTANSSVVDADYV